MKKTVLMLTLALLTGAKCVMAQSLGKTLKSKKDSVQNAAINSAISDPVGTVSSIGGLFHKKKAAANAAPAASTAAPATSTLAAATAPATTAAQAAAAMPPANTKASADNAGLINGNSKAINNGLTFSIVQCTGDKAAQTVTIAFTISNPNKANQNVLVGALNQYVVQSQGYAIDANGSKLTMSSVSLGGKTAVAVLTELPTGIIIRGTIQLINALSSSANIQYLKIPVVSANADGNGDKRETLVEERNIPVTWLN